MLNLDTHMLVHGLADTVTPTERQLLADEPWGISAIVLWELAKLAQLGRVELDLGSPELGKVLASIHVWPLDLEVARASTALDFRSDPADEIIAATSVVHSVPLLTRDRRIRRSRMVPLARTR
ncbi:MAG TPA: PIN domain-containing protein [Myxococcales bacterium]|jgi:PIN domain nuclease of toxin-antitoxin system|nr:PIN domain-containing protein [Myxococcales bacterium]